MLAQPPASVHDHDAPRRSSRVQAVDVASGALRPVAPADWVVLASDHAPWQDSLLVEQHRRPPFEGPEHAPHSYLINIRLSPPSPLEWWVAGGRPRRQLVAPGGVHLTSAGVPMRNRSPAPAEILALALAPHVVRHAVHECARADHLELVNRRAFRQRVGTTPRQYRRQRQPPPRPGPLGRQARCRPLHQAWLTWECSP